MKLTFKKNLASEWVDVPTDVANMFEKEVKSFEDMLRIANLILGMNEWALLQVVIPDESTWFFSMKEPGLMSVNAEVKCLV